MSDILCIYYSRTGHTRRAVKEIAEALGAEITGIYALRYGRHEDIHPAPAAL